MTTRSGHAYKVMDDTPRHQRESSPPHHDTTSTHTHTADRELPNLVQTMQAMLEDRRLQEAEIAEDRKRREIENEERMRGMREQIEMLQQLVTDRTTATTCRSPNDGEGMRLTRLSDQDDIEAYLLTFERMMQAYEVDRPRWTYKLAPQLTGKAQQAYAALSIADASDYDTLKIAILRWYNINEETYRRQFVGETQEGRDPTGARHPPSRPSQEMGKRVWNYGCTLRPDGERTAIELPARRGQSVD